MIRYWWFRYWNRERVQSLYRHFYAQKWWALFRNGMRNDVLEMIAKRLAGP